MDRATETKFALYEVDLLHSYAKGDSAPGVSETIAGVYVEDAFT